VTHIRKALVALLTALGVAVSLGLLPEPYVSWVPVVVAFLGAYGVYAVPND
jgi:hypothetical protein